MKIKQEKGITLVALIITIIILIILAAVTINAVMHNGFIDIAVNAAQNYTQEQYKEADEMSKTANIIDSIKKDETISEKEISISLHFDSGMLDELKNAANLDFKICIYKYADIDSSGNINVCEEFEPITLLEVDKITDEDLINNRLGFYGSASGSFAHYIIESGRTNPLATIEVNNESINSEMTLIKSNKLNNSIFFMTCESDDRYMAESTEDGDERIYTDLTGDDEMIYSVPFVLWNCIVKEGNEMYGLILPADGRGPYSVVSSDGEQLKLDILGIMYEKVKIEDEITN